MAEHSPSIAHGSLFGRYSIRNEILKEPTDLARNGYLGGGRDGGRRDISSHSYLRALMYALKRRRLAPPARTKARLGATTRRTEWTNSGRSADAFLWRSTSTQTQTTVTSFRHSSVVQQQQLQPASK
ncbi:hypothetical protein GQ600_27364 [Phytophthora cactorum]|nr:hypothetical protein GQ600_27364 [Phytophthora cactorum]